MKLVKISVQNQQGQAVVNKALVSAYVRYVRHNLRQWPAYVLTRSEVAGSNKKRRKQTGIGRARYGNDKSPLVYGGGRVFGPRGPGRPLSMNKKERRAAIRNVWLNTLQDKEVYMCSDIFERTAECHQYLSNNIDISRNILVVAFNKSISGLRNLSYVRTTNPYPAVVDVLKAKVIMFVDKQDALDFMYKYNLNINFSDGPKL